MLVEFKVDIKSFGEYQLRDITWATQVAHAAQEMGGMECEFDTESLYEMLRKRLTETNCNVLKLIVHVEDTNEDISSWLKATFTLVLENKRNRYEERRYSIVKNFVGQSNKNDRVEEVIEKLIELI